MKGLTGFALTRERGLMQKVRNGVVAMRKQNKDLLAKKAAEFIQNNPELAWAIYQTNRLSVYKEAIVSSLEQKAGKDFVQNVSDDDLDGLTEKLVSELSGNQPYWDAYYESVDGVVNGFVGEQTKELAPERPNAVADGIDKAVLREILERQQADRVEGGMFGITECKKAIQFNLDIDKKESLGHLLQGYVERVQKDVFFNKQMVLACWEMMDQQEQVRILGDVEMKAGNKQQCPLDHAIAAAAGRKKKVPQKSGKKNETQDREQF